MKSGKKLKILAAVLSVFLVLSAAALVAVRYWQNQPGAVAAGNRIGSIRSGALPSKPSVRSAKKSRTASNGQPIEAELSLSSKRASDNTPFRAENMFPGDSESKLYRVQISYTGAVTLRFHADIRPESDALSQVLQIRVTLPGFGSTLYEGPMAEMPGSIDLPLSAAKKTTENVEYAITAWLDTSVGNKYQNKSLTADFRWWVEETGNLQPPPNTADTLWILFWVVLALTACGAMAALLILRRKGGFRHG